MTSSSTASTHVPAHDEPLDPAVWRVAIAIIVGAFMSIIDMTIVNVALRELGNDLGASGFDEVQWVMTAYMLAVAAVIPITGWASERIGGRRLFLGSLVLFTVASGLCAVAWNLWSLVGFRVLQGIAGGALMPAGQILLARAAGPHRMGRVMAVVGVPILLAPVLGPVIGGLILDSLAWEWIFLVNIPVGIIGFVVATRLLPTDTAAAHDHRTDRRLDAVGLALMSTGLPLIVYGLANVAGFGIDATRTWLPIAAGLLLVVAFVRHAWNHDNPLLNVRLFRNTSYALASLTTFSLGAFLFGSIVLLPLYYQVARGEDVLTTGLLLAPQGIGAALGIAITGRLADRIGGGTVTLVGICILLFGTIPFTMLDGSTSYWLLTSAMVVRGFGFGSTMMPTMAAAYATLNPKDIAHATPQLNVLQRVGGSVGTALLATILQAQLTDAAGGRAQVGEGSANIAQAPPQVLDAIGGAFGDTFVWVVATTAIAIIPTAFLMRAERRVRAERAQQATLAAEAARAADDLEFA
jgi:EmrB/QacA subfamily drug resistance transporter